jgi:hypothetical protein
MGTFTTVSPKTGSNGTVLSVSGPAYTGRTAVTETYQVKTSSGSPQKIVTLSATRAAAGLILTFEGINPPQTTALFPAEASMGYVIDGTSNAPMLYFSVEKDGNFFLLYNRLISTDGGKKWTAITSGTAIANDPGARATYKWRVSFSFEEENLTLFTRTATVTIGTVAPNSPTTAPGQRIVVNLTQAAGTPSLSLSAASVTLATSGAAQTVTVTSNAPFTVS